MPRAKCAMTSKHFRLTAKYRRFPMPPAQSEDLPRLKQLGGKECSMGLAIYWPGKHQKSNMLWMFLAILVLQFLPNVVARPSKRSINDRLMRGLIRPLPCHDTKTGKSGICMFTLNCIQAKGSPLTTCKDGIFLGSCCHIPSESDLPDGLHDLPGNDLNSNPDFATYSWKWTTSSPEYSSSSASHMSFVTSVVTSFGVDKTTVKSTVPSTSPANTKTSLSDNELIHGVLDVMNSEKNSSESNNIPTSSWKVTPADSSSTLLLSLITRRPIMSTLRSTERTTPEIAIIDWAIMSESKGNYTSLPSTTPSTTSETIPTTLFLKTTVFPKTTATTKRRRTTVKTRPLLTTQTPPAMTTTTTAASTILLSSTIPFTTTEFNIVNADFRDACGRKFYYDKRTARIEGGNRSAFGKWPWQVSLRQWKKNTFQHKCGAALLNENWAISAAHCVDNVPVEQLQVRIGDFNINDESEPLPHVDRQVQIIAKHPDFNPRNFENDLALIRFYEPVQFQRNIIPICLPQDDNSFINDTAFVTGWGRLYEDGPLPNELNEAEIPIMSNLECEQLYRKAGYIESIPDIFLCAGRPLGGVDSCEGDSGGPMVIRGADDRWFLAGIISWGIGCAEPNQPGVYTRVSRFRDWINAILVF